MLYHLNMKDIWSLDATADSLETAYGKCYNCPSPSHIQPRVLSETELNGIAALLEKERLTSGQKRETI